MGEGGVVMKEIAANAVAWAKRKRNEKTNMSFISDL